MRPWPLAFVLVFVGVVARPAVAASRGRHNTTRMVAGHWEVCWGPRAGGTAFLVTARGTCNEFCAAQGGACVLACDTSGVCVRRAAVEWSAVRAGLGVPLVSVWRRPPVHGRARGRPGSARLAHAPVFPRPPSLQTTHRLPGGLGALPVLGLDLSSLAGADTHDAAAAQAFRLVVDAVAKGVRLFDAAADNSAGLKGLGNAVRHVVGAGGVRRDELVVCLRVPGLSVVRVVVDLLDGLLAGLGYFDVVLLSRSAGGPASRLATWTAMQHLARTGIARHLGTNDHDRIADLVPLLESGLPHLPQVVRVELHPTRVRPALVDFCRQHGLVIVASTPLGPSAATLAPSWARLRRLLPRPARKERTLSQVVLRWHLQHGFVPVLRCASVEELHSSLRVFDFALADAAMRGVDALAPPAVDPVEHVPIAWAPPKDKRGQGGT